MVLNSFILEAELEESFGQEKLRDQKITLVTVKLPDFEHILILFVMQLEGALLRFSRIEKDSLCCNQFVMTPKTYHFI